FIDRRFPPHGGRPLVSRVEHALVAYVRGQVLLALIIGASAGAGLYVLGLVGLLPGGDKYALIFGGFVALTDVLPYIGPVLRGAAGLPVRPARARLRGMRGRPGTAGRRRAQGRPGGASARRAAATPGRRRAPGRRRPAGETAGRPEEGEPLGDAVRRADFEDA